MTYQIIITEETAANIIIDNNTTNVSITSNEYPITIEYNAVIEQAGGNAYGNANVTTFLASGTNTGNIITTANVSGAFILGNGSQLTGIVATSTYGNANVAANLAAFGSNPISTTGNITAGYFAGNGSLLTNITGANVTGTVANATYALNANAATFATTAVQANVANVANSVAGANVSGTVANATYALNANASTFATQATFATTANAVAGANVSGTVANATYALNSNAATFAGTVTTAAQPNITSVGILTAINTSGNVSAAGNVTGNYFIGNGSQLTGLPATYGNANVAANLAAFANNPISTSGNITSGNLNVGIDAVITGNLTVNGTTTTVNSNTVTINDKFINVANNASSAALANGGGLGVGPVGTEYATLTYNSTANIWTTNIGLSVTGNVTGNVFTGNGSGLTDINAGNIVGAYGNANVANFLGNGFGSNTITTTGNITAGNINTTNYVAFGTAGAQTTAATGQMFWDTTEQTVSLGMNNGVTQQIGLEQYILVKASAAITNGQAVMFTGANGDNVLAAPADTTSVGFRPEYIIGVATQDIANNAFGYITVTGLVHGLNTNAYNVGDILWVSNTTPGALTATRPSDPNFQIEIAAVTKKSGGDGHIQVRVTAFNNLDSLTDVTITSAATGQALVYSGNVWVNGTPQLANTANTVTDAAQANITSVGTLTSLSVSGNVDAGNLRTAGQVTATGNINGANLVATANLTSTQQTVVGTANTGTTGNIVMSGRNIATDMKFSPDGSTGTAQYTGRVMIGTGWLGNNAVGQPSRLAVSDVIERTNTGTNIKHFDVDSIVSLAANVTNSSFRQHGIGTIVRVGGGSAANTYSGSTGAGVVNAFAGIQPQVNIGNVSPYFLGNTTISHASINGGFITINAGSQLGNAYGMIPGLISAGSPTPNITNYTGFASQLSAAPIVTGNAYAYYHPAAVGTAEATATGLAINSGVRGATNYYAFRNDDAVAQVKLGSLRSYNEFQYPTATSGTVNIDKLNAQVQFLNPTANVTIGDLQNFVSVANDGTNNDNQTDTVTLIIQQGATPYTVTMPTGNAAIKYAGGVSTIGATANAVTMVSITAMKSLGNALGSTLYLASVSSEFT